MNAELLKRLDLLAAKLGTTAHYLWSVLVCQVRVEIATDVIIIAFAVVGVYHWVCYGVRMANHFIDNYGLSGYGLLYILGSVTALVFVVFAVIAALELPTLVFNPEYWALKQVLGALGW